MLELFYHEHNLDIATIIDGSIFKKIYKNITAEKKLGNKILIRYYYLQSENI